LNFVKVSEFACISRIFPGFIIIGEGMLSTIEAIYVAAQEVVLSNKHTWSNTDKANLQHLLYIFALNRAIAATAAVEKGKPAPHSDIDKKLRQRKLSYIGTEKHRRDIEKGRELKALHRKQKVSLGERLEKLNLSKGYNSAKNYRKISIWAVPDSEHFDTLQSQIKLLSKTHQLPCFIPHVTLMGGIKCKSEEVVDQYIHLLTCRLRGKFDSIRVIMEGPVTTAFISPDLPKWNQSCVIAVKETEQFMNFVSTIESILNSTNNDINDFQQGNDRKRVKFPEPFGRPHFSFAYGNEKSVCATFKPAVLDFQCREIMIWDTSNATLEGVESWRKLASISL